MRKKSKIVTFKRGQCARISKQPVYMHDILVAGKRAKITHSTKIRKKWDNQLKEFVFGDNAIIYLDIDKRYGMPHTGIWAGNVKKIKGRC